jgi:hypothetical protein
MLDAWIETCAPAPGDADCATVAAQAEAFARALEDLENSPPGRAPDRRRRLHGLRRDLDETCRATFLQATERDLLAPVARLIQAAPASDAEMDALEENARRLKRLELAGRRIGNPQVYDRTLRQVAGALAADPAGGAGLRPVERARLVEILAGPEAALPLLAPA